jgi:DNA-directed RNA polymerase alpha subunit
MSDWGPPNVVELTREQDALLANVGLPQNGDSFPVRVQMAIRLGAEKQRQDVRAAWLKEPIVSLPISKRVANILERNGIATVSDLVKLDGLDVRDIPGLGWKSVCQIEDALSECGHYLANF